MKDTLFEPGLGIGGPRMIMYRAERQEHAEWLKAHVWELKDYGMMLEKSATDIYINTGVIHELVQGGKIQPRHRSRIDPRLS